METLSATIKYRPIKGGEDVGEDNDLRYVMDVGRKYRAPVPLGAVVSKKAEYIRFVSRDYAILRTYHLNGLTQKQISAAIGAPQQRISDVIQSKEPGVEIFRGFVDRELAQIVYMSGIGIPEEVIPDIMNVNPGSNPFSYSDYITKDWRGCPL